MSLRMRGGGGLPWNLEAGGAGRGLQLQVSACACVCARIRLRDTGEGGYNVIIRDKKTL